MSEVACPFCEIDPSRVFHAGNLVVGLWDAYPVSPGHALLVTRRHVPTWFDATRDERDELIRSIDVARDAIGAKYGASGFNIGVNVGKAAGQTIFHLHLHVIPRREGDVPDPRGGIRRVFPELAVYPMGGSGDAFVAESTARVTSVARLRPEPDDLSSVEGVPDVAGFGERMLQLLEETRRTSTYKLAVLLGLIGICQESSASRDGSELVVSTEQLAERVLDVYWPHTAEYEGINDWRGVLKQNTGGQAEIISRIQEFRTRERADGSEPLSRARHRAPEEFTRLVREIEWKLVEMPLPKLQRLGNSDSRFLYELEWTDKVKRGDFDKGGFRHRIVLKAGIAAQLARLSGLLRPLVQRRWAAMIAGLNPKATDESKLQEFLFGASRISLDAVRGDLRELQDDRCFYCASRLKEKVEVDHFVPWARVPNNALSNLVVADGKCNNAKRDFLAAGAHVEKWCEFSSRHTSELADIAERRGWDLDSTRTTNIARSVYLPLPGDVQLWVNSREFVPVMQERARIQHALR